jgi:YD repeat-containing protein
VWSSHYDAFGRTVEVTHGLSTLTPQRSTSFVYDAEARVTWIESPEGVVSYGYDLLGRRIRTSKQR